jgi:hypothetical protein
MAACEYFEFQNDNWYGPKYNEGRIASNFECSSLPICKENSASHFAMAFLIMAAGSISSYIL